MRRLPPLSTRLRRLTADRRAATAVEYGLIVALIVLATIGALKGLASATTGLWDNTSSAVQAAGPR